MRTPSVRGSAPPDSPVPEPLATYGTPSRAQILTIAAICSAVPGSTTMPGVARWWVRPSHSYVRSRTGSVMTFSSPAIAAKRAESAETSMTPL